MEWITSLDELEHEVEALFSDNRPLYVAHSIFVGNTAARALKLLEGYAAEQVAEICSTAAWMVEELDERGIMDDVADHHADDLDWQMASHARVLRYGMDSFDVDTSGQKPGWPAYFAGVALNTLAAELRRQKGKPRAGKFQGYPLTYMNALEAVMIGELLVSTEEAERLGYRRAQAEQKKATKVRAQQGGYARHGEVNALKRDCIRYFMEAREHSPNISQRQAAKRFYENLDDGRKHLLSADNALRTLRDALSKYLNGRLPDHLKP